MTPKERFEDAQKRVNGLSKKPDNPTLLKLYGLYKQASVGDATGKRPGMMDIRGRAKFDAWAGYKGKTSEQAIDEYVQFVDHLVGSQ